MGVISVPDESGEGFKNLVVTGTLAQLDQAQDAANAQATIQFIRGLAAALAGIGAAQQGFQAVAGSTGSNSTGSQTVPQAEPSEVSRPDFPTARTPAAGTAPPVGTGSQSIRPPAASAFPEGTFTLTNIGWPTGPFQYEAGVSGPQGTVVTPSSDSIFAANRALANRTNAGTRRLEGYRGMDIQINEKVPIVLGGSPTDPANKMLVTEAEHVLFNDWLRPLSTQLDKQGWRK
jgi:hypothetical protein